MGDKKRWFEYQTYDIALTTAFRFTEYCRLIQRYSNDSLHATALPLRGYFLDGRN